jgi:ABC-type Na+ efflux pump permease subunit
MMTPALRAEWLIGRSVVLELLRKRTLWVVVFLMLIFSAGAAGARAVGIENASTATFLVNLGLTLAYGASHLLTLVMAGRQLPDELERRTVYPLLSAPIPREALILGKWLACTLCGTAVFLVLFLLGWLPLSRLAGLSGRLLLQTLALIPVSLAAVAALALAGSLVMPRGVLLVVLGGWLFLGPQLSGLPTRVAGHGRVRSGMEWLVAYLPDFSKMNLITRYTDGTAPLSAWLFLGLLGYGALFAAVALGAGSVLLRRRAL